MSRGISVIMTFTKGSISFLLLVAILAQIPAFAGSADPVAGSEADLDAPRATVGSTHTVEVIDDEGAAAKQLQLIRSIELAYDVKKLSTAILVPLTTAGLDVGMVVNTFPPNSFKSCDPAMATSTSAGIDCISKKVGSFEAQVGMNKLRQIPDKVYNDGVHAADFDTDEMPPWFVRKVKAQCPANLDSGNFDSCVVGIVEQEAEKYDRIQGKLHNAKVILGNRSTALAACYKKFGKKECSEQFGRAFAQGFKGGSGSLWGNSQGGNPNAGERPRPGVATGLTAQEGNAGGKDQVSCPSFIPEEACRSGANQDATELAKHWRKNEKGDWIKPKEEITDTSFTSFAKLRSQFGDLNYSLNRGNFEREITNQVSDMAIAGYMREFVKNAHTVDSNDTADAMALAATRLKSKLAAKGCSQVASRIDAMVERSPRIDAHGVAYAAAEQKVADIYAARCMTALGSRINELSRDVGLIDEKGRPFNYGGAVIDERGMDLAFANARIEAHKALKGTPGDLNAQIALYTGQGIIKFVTNLPGFKTALIDSQVRLDKGIGNCIGLGAISSPECRGKLEELGIRTARMREFTIKHPRLFSAVEGSSRKQYEVIASKSGWLDPKNIEAACSSRKNPEDPQSEVVPPSSEELAALEEVNGKTGSIVEKKLNDFVESLNHACHPGSSTEITKYAFAHPEFMQSYFACMSQGFGKISPQECRERKDFSMVACTYYKNIKDEEAAAETTALMTRAFGDMMTLSGVGLLAANGVGTAAVQITSTVVGGVMGGAMGAAMGPSMTDESGRLAIGAAFCHSSYGSTIEGCERAFKDRDVLKQELASPRMKAAFQGFLEGGMFGALTPEQAFDAVVADGGQAAKLARGMKYELKAARKDAQDLAKAQAQAVKSEGKLGGNSAVRTAEAQSSKKGIAPTPLRATSEMPVAARAPIEFPAEGEAPFLLTNEKNIPVSLTHEKNIPVPLTHEDNIPVPLAHESNFAIPLTKPKKSAASAVAAAAERPTLGSQIAAKPPTLLTILPDGVTEVGTTRVVGLKTQGLQGEHSLNFIEDYRHGSKGVGASGTRYLSPSQREAFKLHFGSDGKVYDAFGNPFDTVQGAQGRAKIVMDGSGNLYSGVGLAETSFLSGGPVSWAGEIGVVNGDVTLIQPRTESYHLSPELNQQGLSRVESLLGKKKLAELRQNERVLAQEYDPSAIHRESNRITSRPDAHEANASTAPHTNVNLAAPAIGSLKQPPLPSFHSVDSGYVDLFASNSQSPHLSVLVAHDPIVPTYHVGSGSTPPVHEPLTLDLSDLHTQPSSYSIERPKNMGPLTSPHAAPAPAAPNYLLKQEPPAVLADSPTRPVFFDSPTRPVVMKMETTVQKTESAASSGGAPAAKVLPLAPSDLEVTRPVAKMDIPIEANPAIHDSPTRPVLNPNPKAPAPRVVASDAAASTSTATSQAVTARAPLQPMSDFGVTQARGFAVPPEANPAIHDLPTQARSMPRTAAVESAPSAPASAEIALATGKKPVDMDDLEPMTRPVQMDIPAAARPEKRKLPVIQEIGRADNVDHVADHLNDARGLPTSGPEKITPVPEKKIVEPKQVERAGPPSGRSPAGLPAIAEEPRNLAQAPSISSPVKSGNLNISPVAVEHAGEIHPAMKGINPTPSPAEQLAYALRKPDRAAPGYAYRFGFDAPTHADVSGFHMRPPTSGELASSTDITHFQVSTKPHEQLLEEALKAYHYEGMQTTLWGRGGAQDVYVVHPPVPANIEGEAARLEWIENHAMPTALKIRRIKPEIPGPPSAKDIALANHWYQDDIKTIRYAQEVAPKVTVTDPLTGMARPVVKVRPMDMRMADQGVIGMAFGKGLDARKLSQMVYTLIDPKTHKFKINNVGEWPVNVVDAFKKAGFVNKKGIVTPNTVRDAESRLAEMEQFYRETHESVIHFKQKNNRVMPALRSPVLDKNGKLVGKVERLVGFDPSSGTNVQWDPVEKAWMGHDF